MGIDWHYIFDHYVAIPLILPAALIFFAMIIRVVRIFWFQVRQRGFPPIKIQASPDGHGSEFAALLSAYLTQDTPDAVIVIPPGGHGPDAAYPVERPGSTSSWFRTAVRIALSSEPAFEVRVKYVRASGTQASHQATVRVTKTPRNRVVMATSMGHSSEAQLVQQLGCRISHGIHQTRGALSHTPRWERWGADWEGYFKYRSALEEERHGNLRAALIRYNEALAVEPGNFVVSMRKGALLELMQRYDEAVTVYRTCGELWHENIEAKYRLAAALSNGQRPKESAQVLRELCERQLTRKSLRRHRRRSSFTRRNAGERRYWRGWLRRRFVVYGVSKWKAYKTAVQIGLVLTDVQMIESPRETGPAVPQVMARLAEITRRRGGHHGYNRLLHPEQPLDRLSSCLHCAAWHDPIDDKELRMPVPQAINKPKNGVGWLAHYNAALCFSLLIDLPEKEIPSGYDQHCWPIDCARASILEIGTSKRDPWNDLEPNWYQTDPCLRPLRRFLKGHRKRWAEFVGLDPRVISRRSYARLAVRRWWHRLVWLIRHHRR